MTDTPSDDDEEPRRPETGAALLPPHELHIANPVTEVELTLDITPPAEDDDAEADE